ncbi:nesp083 [Neophasia sp. alphabaculovirus]|nr:nesp083 [Neophasia sp. alphabaculovirus]
MRLVILPLHTQHLLQRGEHVAHTAKCRHGKKHTDFSFAKHTLHSETLLVSACGALGSTRSKRGGGKSASKTLNVDSFKSTSTT